MSMKEELQKLRAENALYQKALKTHGIRVRQVSIDKDAMLKLFGVKAVNGELVETTDARQLRINHNTFVSNLIRAVMPYPRGNRNSWVGYKPFKDMTDYEYEECSKLIKKVIKLCLETKERIGNERSASK
jgi:hypothetical protein